MNEFDEWVVHVLKAQNEDLSMAVARVHDAILCAIRIVDASDIEGRVAGQELRVAELVMEQVRHIEEARKLDLDELKAPHRMESP
jgi:hypothetical protein